MTTTPWDGLVECLRPTTWNLLQRSWQNKVWFKTVTVWCLVRVADKLFCRSCGASLAMYMAEARERVPKHNRFTAQLVVPEMGHVADQPVLSSLLTEEVFLALKQWPSNPQPFYHTFQNILLKLRQHRINASFFYTFAPGHWMRMPERIEQPEHLTRSRSPTKMLYSSIPRRQSPQSPQPQLYRELSERPRIPSYSSPLNAQLNAQMARAREISPVRSYMPTKRRNSLQHPQSARSFVPINVFGASMRLPAHQTVVVT